MKINDIFEQGGVGVVAANKKQAKDPRYSSSMTADIKPSETARQAAKFGNKLDKHGHPPLLGESRGITARVMGDQYVNTTNEHDVLTIQDVTVLHPEGKDGFASMDELQANIDAVIPQTAAKIDDNKPTAKSKAAIIAQVKDAANNDQYWVRYIDKVPGTSVHGLWATLRGYKYNTAKAKEEALAIKPSDLILDENPRTQEQLATTIKQGVHKVTDGTPDEDLSRIMDQAVDMAVAGKIAPIKNSNKYATVVSKYGGEYLGPLALLSDKLNGGDIGKAMQTLEINSFKGGKVRFSQSKTQELWDSLIDTSDGKQIQISTKMHEGGGAASSVYGVLKQITPEIGSQHPRAVAAMKALGAGRADEGMIQTAVMYGIISEQSAQAMRSIPKDSRDINVITDAQLKALISAQGVGKDTLTRSDYRVWYHALTALANKVVAAVNADPDFGTAMIKALNNNNFLQLVTKTTMSGEDMSLDYYGKFPTEFSGKPVLRNKTYFATGQKGRIGFKLQVAGAPVDDDSAEPMPAAMPQPKTARSNVARSKRPTWAKAYKNQASPEPGPRKKRD